MFYSIYYKNGCLAVSDLFDMFTQYTFHYHVLRRAYTIHFFIRLIVKNKASTHSLKMVQFSVYFIIYFKTYLKMERDQNRHAVAAFAIAAAALLE